MYAPRHQNKFLVRVNKPVSVSDSDFDRSTQKCIDKGLSVETICEKHQIKSALWD